MSDSRVVAPAHVSDSQVVAPRGKPRNGGYAIVAFLAFCSLADTYQDRWHDISTETAFARHRPVDRMVRHFLSGPICPLAEHVHVRPSSYGGRAGNTKKNGGHTIMAFQTFSSLAETY